MKPSSQPSTKSSKVRRSRRSPAVQTSAPAPAPSYTEWDAAPPDDFEQAATTYDASGPGMDAHAGLNDAGRIDIELNLKTRLPPLPPDYALSVTEPYVDPHATSVPALNILIQLVGSRGDVQPYLSLAIELVMYGHRVRVATHDVFQSFVLVDGKRTLTKRYHKRFLKPMPESVGARLEFFPIGGDPVELMAYMVKNPGLMPGLEAIKKGDIKRKRKMLAGIMESLFLSTHMPDPVTCRPFVADALLCNPPSFAHVHLAEGFGLPLMISFTMPWSPTTAFKHPLVNIKRSNAEPSLTNYFSYALAEIMTWQGIGRLTNKFRVKRLKLRELANREGPSIADYLKVPHMYCWSPSLIPKPQDWKEHIDITGFFFLEDESYTPDPDLSTFLAAGPPPIYIGFGSVVVDDPGKLTAIICHAIAATGMRAIVSAGWSKLGAEGLPSDVFLLGNVPHEWLFSNDRVAAVCHHGGAGTTACGLRHGRPTIVVPFFGDQPWQGAMVHAAGAGPAPIPYSELTADRLIRSIRAALAPEIRGRAASLGAQISQEMGEQAGVKSYHAHLPLLNMRCDLDPKRVASWWCDDLALRLSSVAVQTLVRAKCIDANALTLHRPREYETERRELYLFAANVNALFQVAIDSVEGLSQMVYKPHIGLLKLIKVLPRGVYGMYVGFHEGLRDFAALYGEPMRQRKIEGTRSGFISAGYSLLWGFRDGFGGLVMTPIRQGKRHGWKGAIGGIGQGLLDVAIKPTIGLMALFADPMKGLAVDINRRSFGKNHPFFGPRKSLDALEFAESTKEERDTILEAFKVAVPGVTKRKQSYAKVAQEEARKVEEQTRAAAEVARAMEEELAAVSPQPAVPRSSKN